ncbi:polysaccharide pyruvyl transferase family protein [uncultured Fibrella sp.]|uniref:polysaccharide pyruvyl transferase family protein n=1 Tax=uncultured Fibrella sp. TaxID=1284596 RepID=UPI0035CAD0C8
MPLPSPTRRDFLQQAALLSASMLASHVGLATGQKTNPVILLRSGWQIENIGDVAHTPGFLALMETYLPGARAIFWPHYAILPQSEIDMLEHRFPRLQIVRGKIVDGKPDSPELEKAFAEADLFVHNSGPAMIGWAEAEAFNTRTGKPFGVFGVTYGLYGKQERATLSKADFIYFRDSVSLNLAKQDGITAPIMAFGPDAAFGTDVINGEAATRYLKANNLQPGKFVVCIPKQRHTPAWLHKAKNRPVDTVRQARNEAMKEHDHAPMREAITAIVRQTNCKVLIGHEDETELPIGKEWLLDKLPDDVKKGVVWRSEPWLLEEALGIYRQSAGYFGHEQHTPIMCIGNGIPAILGRWEEQSSKGFMWNDIGLSNWLFDFDREEDIKRYVPTVLDMVKKPVEAKKYARQAQELVRRTHRQGFQVMENAINKAKKQG